VTAFVPSMGPKVCRKAHAVSSAPPCGGVGWQHAMRSKTIAKGACAVSSVCKNAQAASNAAPCGGVTLYMCAWAAPVGQRGKEGPPDRHYTSWPSSKPAHTPAQPAARAAARAPWQHAQEGTARSTIDWNTISILSGGKGMPAHASKASCLGGNCGGQPEREQHT